MIGSFNFKGTVLLATNVAFLAIPSIDNGDLDPSRSPAQIVSYISVICVISSIVVGQLLARYNRSKGWETLDERVCSSVLLYCSPPSYVSL